MMKTEDVLGATALRGLECAHRGKVRDVYRVDEDRLLIVTTDRLSAFDVVMTQPVAGKGRILNALSGFWFERTKDLIKNHLLPTRPEEVLPADETTAAIVARSAVVAKTTPLPFEAVVRGYLAGSGWKDYYASGAVCGVALPHGLRQADRLPEPVFTPATKAAVGEHDENVSFEVMANGIGVELADRVRDVSLAIYTRCAEYALSRGIIIADTKFEFGLTFSGELILIDEVLTPDSSRFWASATWRSGESPASFDKQFVRDYLESLAWDKTPPPPRLPTEVLDETAEKYRQAFRMLTGRNAS